MVSYLLGFLSPPYARLEAPKGQTGAAFCLVNGCIPAPGQAPGTNFTVSPRVNEQSHNGANDQDAPCNKHHYGMNITVE